MTGGSIDEILESLSITAKRNLAESRHRQQPSKGVECFLLENRILLVEGLAQPFLKGLQQANVCIEERIHRLRVFAQQAVALQVGLRDVVEIPAAGFRTEVDVTCGLLDGLQADAL